MTTADKPVRPLRRFVASLTIGTLVGGIGAFAWGTTALAAEARAAQETYRANVQVATDAHRAEATFWQAAEQQVAQARAEQHRVALTEAREDVIDHIRGYEGLAADTAGKVTDSGAHDALVDGIEELSAEAATAHMGELEGIREQVDELAAAVEESHAEWQAEQERIRQEEERRAREEAERQAATERARQQATPTTTPSRSNAPAATRPSQTGPTTVDRGASGARKPPPLTRNTADEIAAQHGLRVAYVSESPSLGICPDFNEGSATATWIMVHGCYLTATPDTIYLSTAALHGTFPAAVDVVKSVAAHEVAHAIIYRQCGTTRVGGERYEHVTDAYTALYLDGPGAAGGYGYTDADAAVARDILAGRC